MLAMLVGVETIAPRELHQLVEGRRVTVIDCNSRQRWGARVRGQLAWRPTGKLELRLV